MIPSEEPRRRLRMGPKTISSNNIVAIGCALKDKAKEPEKWILHSYGNNVALYNGDRIVEVYGSIVLNTLPSDDKKQLDNGIAFSTREEAVSAIEDYDG